MSTIKVKVSLLVMSTLIVNIKKYVSRGRHVFRRSSLKEIKWINEPRRTRWEKGIKLRKATQSILSYQTSPRWILMFLTLCSCEHRLSQNLNWDVVNAPIDTLCLLNSLRLSGLRLSPFVPFLSLRFILSTNVKNFTNTSNEDYITMILGLVRTLLREKITKS